MARYFKNEVMHAVTIYDDDGDNIKFIPVGSNNIVVSIWSDGSNEYDAAAVSIPIDWLVKAALEIERLR